MGPGGGASPLRYKSFAAGLVVFYLSCNPGLPSTSSPPDSRENVSERPPSIPVQRKRKLVNNKNIPEGYETFRNESRPISTGDVPVLSTPSHVRPGVPGPLSEKSFGVFPSLDPKTRWCVIAGTRDSRPEPLRPGILNVEPPTQKRLRP